jgi:two-component system copper resistance phosphate regulon response regulator CusR
MRILIAEDHVGLLEVLSVYFTNLKFEVEVALNGQDALMMAQQQKYDALVLDICLPQKSGYEVITALRCLRNALPILVISARGAVEDRVKALNLGADDYMVKDFALSELGARLNCLIRRSDGEPKNLLYCGNLTLDMADMTVKRKTKAINLTKKEFIILAELLRKKNKLVSTQHLMEAAWGEPNLEVISNKLNVHVRSLRMKVDSPFEKPLIKTMRGFGYKISAS